MSLLSEAGWDSATIADPPPVPKPAGQVESLSVSGFPDGTWHFGLKAADEVPNWSALSNIVSATLVDTIPPGRVTDLAAVFATTASVELNWTAPGDDGGEGGASEYDLRYALTPITEETWDDALRVEDVPAPGSAGSPESYTVTGLELGTTYSFALKAVDDVFNWSELSNVVSRLTAYVVRLTFSPAGPSWSGARRPIWSPAGQNIVFRADWGDDNHYTELYLISASGGEPERLTYDPDTMFGACWSRDGSRIAFSSSKNGVSDIWILVLE
ncbi:MAG: fibronectin type III domain-containing protein, partial [Candidatus Eisenbacteria sp.]|nr:fibronectin type III domain-containing protein [Candidatus Eisenbacteria bacterium]